MMSSIRIPGALTEGSDGAKAYRIYKAYEDARKTALEQFGIQTNALYQSIIEKTESPVPEENSWWANFWNTAKTGMTATAVTALGGIQAAFAYGVINVVKDAADAAYVAVTGSDTSQDVTLHGLEFPKKQIFGKNSNLISPVGPLSSDQVVRLNQHYNNICQYIEDKKRRDYFMFRSFNEHAISDQKYMAAVLLANKIKSLLTSPNDQAPYFNYLHLSQVLDKFIADEELLKTNSTDYLFLSLQTVIHPLFMEFSTTGKALAKKDYDAEQFENDKLQLKQVHDSNQIHFVDICNQFEISIKSLPKDNDLYKNLNESLNNLRNTLNINYDFDKLSQKIDIIWGALDNFVEAKKEYLKAKLSKEQFENLNPEGRTNVCNFVKLHDQELNHLSVWLMDLKAHHLLINRKSQKDFAPDASNLDDSFVIVPELNASNIADSFVLLPNDLAKSVIASNSNRSKDPRENVKNDFEAIDELCKSDIYTDWLVMQNPNDQPHNKNDDGKGKTVAIPRESKTGVKAAQKEREKEIKKEVERSREIMEYRQNIQTVFNEFISKYIEFTQKCGKESYFSFFYWHHGDKGEFAAYRIIQCFNNLVKDLTPKNQAQKFNEMLRNKDSLLTGNYHENSLKTYLLAFSNWLVKSPSDKNRLDDRLRDIQLGASSSEREHRYRNRIGLEKPKPSATEQGFYNHGTR